MGREFLGIFTEWSSDYDNFVEGNDSEYKAVFEGYSSILEEIVQRSGMNILEFGIGTGNLTQQLILAGKWVFPIEPSKEMRELAKKKLPSGVIIYDGDLQHYPKPTKSVDTIVSSYVFHHLTDTEKETSLKKYADELGEGGKVVFADTMFESQEALEQKIEQAKEKKFYALADDLEREYYSLIPTLLTLFDQAGFNTSVQQMNDYVWIIEGVKRG
ncbi:class I SAM-dependent methyltransferase [Carnobacterium pleistocenium]|uniref:class I SAM-dependent methyltransferase n=1 Tax=Carnobacterium pleistocenium TaxID=181073 RepID=UPI0005542A32|nr:class I SAM-dependent methyltransferase [Carnobacterium pleistocenium]